ncbi:MAG: type IV pilus secretin PilQ [candidate division Zixibacteria bacterium]|nr:type IV pilus secretin PilQ [candidate division Zixibacteria bacterium]
MIGKKRYKGVLRAVVLLLLLLTPIQAVWGQDDPGAPIKNLNFQNADIRKVIAFLSDYGQVNIVTAPEVEGTVTFSLKQVTWREALNILCKTYSLSAVTEQDYIRVLPTKKYLEEVSLLEKHKYEQKQLVELSTAVLKIDNAHADDLEATVKPLLSPRGKVKVDKRTNSVIVRDIPRNIDRIKSLVTKLDRRTRQIKISAKLVEVSTSALQEIGVDWTLTGMKRTASGEEYNYTTKQSLDLVADPAGNFLFSTVQDGWDLAASISALVGDGKGKIIAHPEVTTVDNKQARIQMGQKIPIKQFDASGNIAITFQEVGTLLRVTPHITSENRILMTLEPERSTYEFDPNGIIINTSNAQTTVVVENGQTAVIGGLTTQDVTTSRVGIPILKDIPILQYLFSYSKKKVENRDLIIFVTPTIVDDNLASTADDQGGN